MQHRLLTIVRGEQQGWEERLYPGMTLRETMEWRASGFGEVEGDLMDQKRARFFSDPPGDSLLLVSAAILRWLAG
jgi:hypothetical protein